MLNDLDGLEVMGCSLRVLPFKMVEGEAGTLLWVLPFKMVEGEAGTLLFKHGKAWNKLENANDNCMFGLTRLWLHNIKASEVDF